MEPKDVLWRILDRLDDQLRLLDESYELVDPKKNGDIRDAIQECERLANTQKNLINRLRRRYP